MRGISTFDLSTRGEGTMTILDKLGLDLKSSGSLSVTRWFGQNFAKFLVKVAKKVAKIKIISNGPKKCA